MASPGPWDDSELSSLAGGFERFAGCRASDVMNSPGILKGGFWLAGEK